MREAAIFFAASLTIGSGEGATGDTGPVDGEVDRELSGRMVKLGDDDADRPREVEVEEDDGGHPGRRGIRDLARVAVARGRGEGEGKVDGDVFLGVEDTLGRGAVDRRGMRERASVALAKGRCVGDIDTLRGGGPRGSRRGRGRAKGPARGRVLTRASQKGFVIVLQLGKPGSLV